MKPLYATLLLTLLLTACAPTKESNPSNPIIAQDISPSLSEASSISASALENNGENFLQKIIVTYREDSESNTKRRMIVDVENKTDKIFNGDIFVSFKGTNPSTSTSDTIFVENLKPNGKTWANIFVDESAEYEFNHRFSAYTFADIESGGTEVINEQLSNSLSAYMFENFGGGGIPEMAATWYTYIDNVSVVSDGAVYFAKVALQDIDYKMLINEKLEQMSASDLLTVSDTDFLEALGIPAIKYLSTASGQSENNINEMLMNGKVPGEIGTQALRDYIKANESSSENKQNSVLPFMDRIANSILKGFQEADICKVAINDNNGNEITTLYK